LGYDASLHSVHYADANGAEIAVIEGFLKKIEILFGQHSPFGLSFATKMFIDFILETRKLQRLEDRGLIYQTPDLNFTA
jgi:hypothetical protein